MNNKGIIIGIVLLLILGGVIYFATSNEDDGIKGNSAQDTETQDKTNAGTSLEGSDNDSNIGSTNSINSVFLYPVETGKKVTVKSATFTKPGYIVVYSVNSNSETKVIGNSELILPGTINDLDISLDVIVALKQTVVAVLHEDDGDGKFEYPGSDLYLGNPNQPIVSDVDVVDVSAEDEDAVLQKQVEVFLENNSKVTTE